MTDIQQLVRLLQSDQPQVRRDACEQLMVLPVLTEEAIVALKMATHDSDTTVARAAEQAMELHESDVMLSQAAIDTLNVSIDTPQQASTKATIAQLEEKIKLEKAIKGGASNFYWIAALSIINSIAVLTGGNWSFFIGLGITQLIDGIFMIIVQSADESFAFITQIIGFAINLIFVGIFVVFGVFAQKQKKWAFIMGMVLYALDGLIFLLVSDFFSIGFHILILFFISGGMNAMKRYSELMAKISA